VWRIIESHRPWRRYEKKLKRRVALSQWTPWPRLHVNQSAGLGSVCKLMVGTLNTCSSSTYVAAIPFCVYQVWVISELFKQIFCKLKYVYIFEPLCSNNWAVETEMTGVSVTLSICIRDILGSNLVQDTGCHD
jgi:hypothetical protein